MGVVLEDRFERTVRINRTLRIIGKFKTRLYLKIRSNFDQDEDIELMFELK